MNGSPQPRRRGRWLALLLSLLVFAPPEAHAAPGATRGEARRSAPKRKTTSSAAQSAGSRAAARRPRRRSGSPRAGVARPARQASAPHNALARTLSVRVVEVAGGRAYLTPGVERAVRVDQRVRLGGRSYPVLASNSKHIVIATAGRAPSVGQRGEVNVRRVGVRVFRERTTPRPLAAFAGRWLPPSVPADSQRPAPVPLGVVRDTRRNRAVFSLDYQRIQPLSGPAYGIGRTRLRASLHAELPGTGLQLDGDVFAELWQATDLARRPWNESRPFITVRQLELAYRGEALRAAAGRLRFASRTLGTLDGARVSTALGDAWSVAAFGGVMADPLSGGLSTDASRFGTELAWAPPDAAWQPQASLTLQGSRFLGQLDERRVSGLFEAFPDFGRLGARAEVSLFDAENPWAAAPTELTAAGADASVRFDALRLGASVDMRTPERSLWLASFLPRGYFCVAEPAPAQVIEPCVGGERRYAATVDAAWEATVWTANAGATLATTRRASADQATMFANLRLREVAGLLRLDTGGSLSRGSLYESFALTVASGSPLLQGSADVSFHYRPTWMRYRAERNDSIEHGFGARVWWAPSPVLDFSGSADVLTGRDVDALLFQLTATYRPRF